MFDRRRLLQLNGLAAVVISLVLTASAVGAITVTPAPPGGPPVDNFGAGAGVVPDPALLGYQGAQFFLEGTAQSYHNVEGEPFGNDGLWTIEPDAAPTPAFKTRVHVFKPNAKKFNGTVYVEWVNVSGQADFGVDWAGAHVEMVRQGAAYVAVSAQAVGVNAAIAGAPDYYGAAGANLIHPGDSYSYDIFSQAGFAARDEAATLFGPGYKVKRLIAVGESQSAGRLTTYVNLVAKLDEAYDGYLIHSRGATGAALRSDIVGPPALPAIAAPANTKTRSDLSQPVFEFQTEWDTRQGRQPDSLVYRRWEVAGTAHVDAYWPHVSPEDVGDYASAEKLFNFMLEPSFDAGLGRICAVGINAGPQHWVLQAAISHLNRWVKFGSPPPSGGPGLTTVDPSNPGSPLVLDEHGNATGGVRTPHVDVPVATLKGFEFVPGSNLSCIAYGTTRPFSPEKISELYPSHFAFSSAWVRSTVEAMGKGFILPADAFFVALPAVFSDVAR